MSRQTERIERALIGAAEEVVRRLQLRTWQILAVETPVDLGTARSGWTPSAGSPADRPILAAETDEATRAAATARFAENRARAERLANTYRTNQGRAFLTNPVPWIVPLNGGSSAQAPANFVPRAISKAIRSLPRTIDGN